MPKVSVSLQTAVQTLLRLVSAEVQYVSPVKQRVSVADRLLLLLRLLQLVTNTLKKQAFMFRFALTVVSFMTII